MPDHMANRKSQTGCSHPYITNRLGGPLCCTWVEITAGRGNILPGLIFSNYCFLQCLTRVSHSSGSRCCPQLLQQQAQVSVSTSVTVVLRVQFQVSQLLGSSWHCSSHAGLGIRIPQSSTSASVETFGPKLWQLPRTLPMICSLQPLTHLQTHLSIPSTTTNILVLVWLLYHSVQLSHLSAPGKMPGTLLCLQLIPGSIQRCLFLLWKVTISCATLQFGCQLLNCHCFCLSTASNVTLLCLLQEPKITFWSDSPSLNILHNTEHPTFGASHRAQGRKGFGQPRTVGEVCSEKAVHQDRARTQGIPHLEDSNM